MISVQLINVVLEENTIPAAVVALFKVATALQLTTTGLLASLSLEFFRSEKLFTTLDNFDLFPLDFDLLLNNLFHILFIASNNTKTLHCNDNNSRAFARFD